MLGGIIYEKKILSMTVTEIAKAIEPTNKFEEIGISLGKRLHEQMIGLEDANYTYEYEKYFRILPVMFKQKFIVARVKNGAKLPDDFTYFSDSKDKWVDIDYLRQWVYKT